MEPLDPFEGTEIDRHAGHAVTHSMPGRHVAETWLHSPLKFRHVPPRRHVATLSGESGLHNITT